MFLWNLIIFLTPILSVNNLEISKSLFTFFSFFCHQLFERSICMNDNMEIGNCSASNGFIYQFPICARDIGFYFGMLIGGMIMLIARKGEEKMPNLLFLLIFIFPMAIDGVTQLLYLRESTNELRLITGFLAGVIIPFYLIPILNRFSFRGVGSER
ncbi:MAG: DUF2085 domain-containing protein [Candidatus Micrarchaeia archaeon]